MRIGFLDDHFNQIASKLVFNIGLPALLFTNIVKIDLNNAVDFDVFNFSLFAAVLGFSLSWLVSIWVKPREDRGVFVQGAFRSNLGVIGIALSANAYGAEGLALASLLMASLTVAYNILSVFILSLYANAELVWSKVILDIVKNPLVVSIVVAVTASAVQIPIPEILLSAGEYIGAMALPLALIGTGAGMNLRTLRDSSFSTAGVVILKTLILPFMIAGLAIMLGFRGVTLGVMFLLFVSPTATVSYIMVKAMGANDALAANLIMTTTLVSILTCSLGFFVLRVFGLA